MVEYMWYITDKTGLRYVVDHPREEDSASTTHVEDSVCGGLHSDITPEESHDGMLKANPSKQSSLGWCSCGGPSKAVHLSQPIKMNEEVHQSQSYYFQLSADAGRCHHCMLHSGYVFELFFPTTMSTRAIVFVFF
ncbi:unnamed protein product [Natator depressus]